MSIISYTHLGSRSPLHSKTSEKPRRKRRFSVPQPPQHRRHGASAQHDDKIAIPHHVRDRPGKEHGGVRGRRRRHLGVPVIDRPDLDGAGKDLREGREDGGAGDSY